MGGSRGIFPGPVRESHPQNSHGHENPRAKGKLFKILQERGISAPNNLGFVKIGLLLSIATRKRWEELKWRLKTLQLAHTGDNLQTPPS